MCADDGMLEPDSPGASGPPGPGAVGRNHRRGIRATLVLLDDLLCRIDDWAHGRGVESVLVCELNDLSETQRARLAAIVGELRGVIAQARRELSLTPDVRSVAECIWAECIASRVGVEELSSRHLRRYGKVAPELAGYADALSEALGEGLARMLAVVAGGAADRRPK